MLEWLIIAGLFVFIIGWVRSQSKRPCSGCDGCTAACSLNKAIKDAHCSHDTSKEARSEDS